MASNEIHVGDIGTTLQLTFKDDGSVVDISSANNIYTVSYTHLTLPTTEAV